MKEVARGKLAIIGTGFYVTRYGLFLTAQHVLKDLIDWQTRVVGVGYVCHLPDDYTVHLRRILRVSLLQSADLAIGQADNFLCKYPDDPLINLRATLTAEIPAVGERLITYAYPENEVLDFARKDHMPVVSGDYFEGRLLRYVVDSENPFLPYSHFETSIEVRSGASGGPVFDARGHVVGVNCRGWDFRGGEHEGDNLSSIVPIREVLQLKLDLLQLPPSSWEHTQVPEDRRGQLFTVKELADYGHFLFDPPLYVA